MNSAAVVLAEATQIEELARRVFTEMQFASSELGPIDPEVEIIKQRRSRIMAKEFVTLSEAAFLLLCSDGHIWNLLRKAHSRETEFPIPVRDLDGLFVFNLEELLAWTRESKSRTHKERKSSLRDVSAKVS